MNFEEYKQKLEDSLDYLIECLEENPLDYDAVVYYAQATKDTNIEYLKGFIPNDTLQKD